MSETSMSNLLTQLQDLLQDLKMKEHDYEQRIQLLENDVSTLRDKNMKLEENEKDLLRVSTVVILQKEIDRLRAENQLLHRGRELSKETISESAQGRREMCFKKQKYWYDDENNVYDSKTSDQKIGTRRVKIVFADSK